MYSSPRFPYSSEEPIESILVERLFCLIASAIFKKILVLFLINLTQSGDATGGHILQLYQDIVNCLL